MGLAIEVNLELELAGVGADDEQGLGPRLPAEHELDAGRLSSAQLAREHVRADRQGDHRHAELGEATLELRADHAALPRAPPEGLDQGLGPTPSLGLGDLVEHLVGHGVGALAVVSAARGHGREGAQDSERIVGGRGQQVAQALDLGVEHPAEGVRRRARRCACLRARPRRGPGPAMEPQPWRSSINALVTASRSPTSALR